VGVISKLLFQEMTNHFYLKMTLVFGNKTKEPMFNCSIDYEGDYGMSIWTQEPYYDHKEI
jgi:hypothetical protein